MDGNISYIVIGALLVVVIALLFKVMTQKKVLEEVRVKNKSRSD